MSSLETRGLWGHPRSSPLPWLIRNLLPLPGSWVAPWEETSFHNCVSSQDRVAVLSLMATRFIDVLVNVLSLFPYVFRYVVSSVKLWMTSAPPREALWDNPSLPLWVWLLPYPLRLLSTVQSNCPFTERLHSTVVARTDFRTRLPGSSLS